MKIAIFGSGGVGGYFGGRLAAAGEDVTFIARGEHLAALRRDGLSIESPRGDVKLTSIAATDRPDAVGAVDVVLFTVKLYDVEGAAAALAPLVGPGTVVVTLQNGVDAVNMVSRHVARERLVAGAAYVMAVIAAPGRIRHTSAESLVFGEADGSRSERLTALEAAGVRAGLRASISPSIELALWTKFVRLATWSGMTAVTRSPVGVIRDDPALSAMMAAAFDEAIAVGRARGIAFPETIEEETMEMVRGFPFGSRSSMLEDLERGRPLELAWLSGAVVRFGEETGIPTPTHRFITSVLSPFAAGRAARPAR
jgi:2-dehydropantoate 2-reductase